MYQQVVMLTGSGVSAASGLPTYRGAGGLWESAEVARFAHADAWREEPLAVWRMFGELRAAIAGATPNAGHHAIAALQRALAGAGKRLHVVTQNVDGLHQAAGAQRVVELHGSLLHSRCSNDRCMRSPFPDAQTTFERVPICELCGDLIRPNITLFGEAIGERAERASREAMDGCDLFIAVGTSGMVMPASLFVEGAKAQGARTLLVNLEALDPPNDAYDDEVLGRAEVLLPQLLRYAP